MPYIKRISNYYFAGQSTMRSVFNKTKVEVKLELKTLIAGLFRDESYRDLLEKLRRKKTEKDLVFNS